MRIFSKFILQNVYIYEMKTEVTSSENLDPVTVQILLLPVKFDKKKFLTSLHLKLFFKQ